MCVVGHDRLVDDDAVRPASLEADEVTPVVEHPESLARHRGDDALVLAAGRDERQMVGGIGHPRAEVPRPVNAVSAVDRVGGGLLEAEACGGDEVPVLEQVVLGLRQEVRPHLQRMAGTEGEHPSAGGASARDRRDDAEEGLHVELKTSISARDEDPVEPGILECLVQTFGVVATGLRLRLLLEKLRAQSVRSGHEVVGCDAGGARRIRHCPAELRSLPSPS